MLEGAGQSLQVLLLGQVWEYVPGSSVAGLCAVQQEAVYIFYFMSTGVLKYVVPSRCHLMLGPAAGSWQLGQ